MEKKSDEETSSDAVGARLDVEIRRGRLIKIKMGKKECGQECCFHTL